MQKRFDFRKWMLDIFATSSTYELKDSDVVKFFNYLSPLLLGSKYTLEGVPQSINYRSVETRREKGEVNASSPAEFYKNTILGVIKDLPSYDGSGQFIDVENFNGELDFNPNIVALSDRDLGDASATVFGSHESSPSQLEFACVSEFLGFSDRIKFENFGRDSYCKVQSLVDMVQECYAETGSKVVIVELGPGIGYWINRVGSILKLRKIPFTIVSLEYFYFNSLNTLRMSKYFGINKSLVSVMCDIHDFDWSKFAHDYLPLRSCPIVVHSSGCLDYLPSCAIDRMFCELSQFKLYGGSHHESDAFTLYDSDQKNLYLDYCRDQYGNSLPHPPTGMGSAIRQRAGIGPSSYLDPHFKSSIITSIENFSKIEPLDVKTFFPWAPLSLSPTHYTEWRTKRAW